MEAESGTKKADWSDDKTLASNTGRRMSVIYIYSSCMSPICIVALLFVIMTGATVLLLIDTWLFANASVDNVQAVWSLCHPPPLNTLPWLVHFLIAFLYIAWRICAHFWFVISRNHREALFANQIVSWSNSASDADTVCLYIIKTYFVCCVFLCVCVC